jgi:hypothetical protein
MLLRNFLRTAVLGALFAVQGCALDETPRLEDFKLSSSEVEGGGTTNGTAMVEDDDGDLSGGKMVLTIRAGDVIDKKELPINLCGSAGKAALSLSLEIGRFAPKGPATIDLQVFDEAGHGSNVQTAALTIK